MQIIELGKANISKTDLCQKNQTKETKIHNSQNNDHTIPTDGVGSRDAYESKKSEFMIMSNKSIDDHDQDTQLMMIMSNKSTNDDHDHVK